MQDGAPAHTANASQSWCSDHFPRLQKKGERRGNSPDMNPIENLRQFSQSGWMKWEKFQELMN